MNLYGRLLWILLSGLKPRRPMPFGGISVTSFTVLPHDLDFNLHMNNGRYMTIMDLGRLQLLQDTGTLWRALRRGWFPVLGEGQMIYLRPLSLFQRFSIETQVVDYDGKWFVIYQRFLVRGKTAAVGMVRGLFQGKEGLIPPQRILDLAPAGRDWTPPDNVWARRTREWVRTLDVTRSDLRKKGT